MSASNPRFAKLPGRKALVAAGLFATTLLAGSFAHAEPRVVTTIKPIHSLVSGVMEGVATPDILIDGAASPHGFALKPSQATQLQDADLVFWVGEGLETALAKALTSVAGNAEVIELMEAPGLTLLPYRTSGGFGAHDHDDHEDGEEDHHDDHDDHNEHADDKHDEDHDDDDHAHGHDNHDEDHDDHGDEHEEHADGDEHNHDEHDDHAEGHDDNDEGHDHAAGHDDHDHDGTDAHIWLDPNNALAMIDVIAAELAENDAENAGAYAANADAMKKRITELTAKIDKELAGVRGRPFVVFHDAYHYFEDRFSVQAAGAITLNPETPAGADRISEVRETIKDLGVVCVFSEPQFTPKLVDVVLEGSNAKTAVLDPLGTGLENGPGLYEALLRNTADSMTDCLS
ncbi:zinc ABC transporter substrate-binding protein [uncultured Roseibium sp.]|uniref:zinc ABC transporter substrate-binding protein n=1 Tax=uncultured Roseibium sp. TaxID=1936171 RepID=UPI00259758F9|nr:zinc ABC transporter substrate-binding protein [uncultured Roseibium sp.]